MSDLDAEGAADPRSGGGRRTLLVGLAVAVLVIASIAAVALTRDGDAALPTAGTGGAGRSLAGAPLPELVLDGFDGDDPVALADYRGRPLVVNMWATWCAPCVAEMPDFAALSEELGEQVAILGVDTMDAPAAAEAFVEELGIPYDLAADPQARLFGAVGGYGMPTTLFVDPADTIVASHTGPYDLEGLRDAVQEHLGIDA